MTLQISYFSSMVTYYQNEFKHKNNLIFSEKRFALLLNEHSAASKGQSMVNYCQSLLFDHLYLSSNSHCDQWLFQELFFYQYYFYFLKINLNNLQFLFLEFKHIYKTQRTSLFSFYLFFTCCFVIILCIKVLHLFRTFPLYVHTQDDSVPFLLVVYLGRFIKTNP